MINIRYADDDLQDLMNQIKDVSSKYGLEINMIISRETGGRYGLMIN